MEFGIAALAHEEMWGTLCVMRSANSSEMEGGLTTLYSRLLSLFFGAVHDLRLTGVSVEIDGSLRGEQPMQCMIFAEVGCMLADMSVFREMFWDAKGTLGTYHAAFVGMLPTMRSQAHLCILLAQMLFPSM